MFRLAAIAVVVVVPVLGSAGPFIAHGATPVMPNGGGGFVALLPAPPPGRPLEGGGAIIVVLPSCVLDDDEAEGGFHPPMADLIV